MLRTALVLSTNLLLAGCGLTKALVVNDAGQVGGLLCQLSAVIAKAVDPSGPENNVLGVVCGDVAPVVNVVGGLLPAGHPAQCVLVDIDDSQRFGGDGKLRPHQSVCDWMKADVEAELTKPPAARRR